MLLQSKLYQKINYALVSQLTKRALSKASLEINGIQLANYISKLQTEYAGLKVNAPTTRLRQLSPIISLLDERNELLQASSSLRELLSDKNEGIRLLAQEELAENAAKMQELEDNIKEALLPTQDEDSFSSIVLEVNCGVGGQEAMLFASEMFNMYKNFAVFKHWSFDIADFAETESGGIRHGVMLISGAEAYKYFKHEAGVHRVQRIPATEKSGRIHTSTVSVLAIPQPDEIQVNLDAKDLRIETKRATGAGGQHVNTTDSAVRILHIPSGVAVECQTDRSQRKNKEVAMKRLRAKLYQRQLDEQMSKVQATRKSQVKSNFRNEKIRTYNFNQDRITDHRLDGYHVHNLKGFLLGGDSLETLISKLDYQHRLELLKQLVNE